jgi:hypothetical protein
LIKNCFVEVYFRFSNVILEERMQPLRVEGEDLKGAFVVAFYLFSSNFSQENQQKPC